MKTFILGVGAQKAGTSWLHDYFCQLPGFDPGFEKEYHILDSRHLPQGGRYWLRNIACGLRSAPALAAKATLRKLGIDVEDRHNRVDVARLPLMWSDRAYVDYFAGLLSTAGVTHTADITPEYATLPVSVMKDLRERFGARGIRVKAIFIMRDPVERVWSASRMFVRQQADGRFAGEEGTFVDPAKAVLELCKRPDALALGDYEKTVSSLEEAFGPQDVHFEFYERMFDYSRIEQIADFVGLPYHAPDFSRRVNSAPNKRQIDPAAAEIIRTTFKDTYRFLNTRFPNWKSVNQQQPHVELVRQT